MPDAITPDQTSDVKKVWSSFVRGFRGSGRTYDAAFKQAAELTAGMNDYDADPITSTALMGIGKRVQRTRQQIYNKWMYMLGDGIISAAIKLHVTAALGGHETSDELIFIECLPEYATDKGRKAMVEEMAKDLQPILNKIAYTTAFNCAGYGDGYGRIYSKERVGVTDVVVDEMTLPPLVQAFERAGKTVGFMVGSGFKQTTGERLTVLQMFRAKMQRTVYVPQTRAIEKALKVAITEDDPQKLPILPSLVGGSFLDGAEEPYDNMAATLSGMVGQRILDSIDESVYTLQMQNMTDGQQKKFKANIKALFQASKDYAEQAVKEGRPRLGRLRHFLPVWDDKQVQNINSTMASNRTATLTVDDLMLHLKMLAGSLRMDLSLIGFADLLAGGLGDGGFFRTSAGVAEASRMIRNAISEGFNHIADVHLFMKYGIQLKPNERFWKINFHSGQSAIKREEAAIKLDAINSAALLATVLQQLRDMGAPEEAVIYILQNEMHIDADAAKVYARVVASKAPDTEAA